VGFGAVEIVGVNSEGAGETTAVADQDAAALERLKQPLVRVEGHRVGALDAGQQRAAFRRQRGETAISGIDVQPEPLGGAHVRQPGQGVDGARARRPGARAHRDRNPPGAAVSTGGGGHRLGLQPPVTIGRQYPDLVRAQAHRPGGPGQGGVALIRDVHDAVL
jgi:hypothetical protein